MIATIFMGSCPFGLEILKSILTLGKDFLSVKSVFTAPPKPKGRGQKETKTCVHTFALEKGLPVETPSNLKNQPHILDPFCPQLVVVASYGFIIPEILLRIPQWGFVNVHPSLLPRWRGASPIASTILHGDLNTGISIMLMDKGMDTGPLLSCTSLAVPLNITTPQLSALLAEKAGKQLITTLREYTSGQVQPQPQSLHGVTYAKKFSREDGRLDWAHSASFLQQQVLALNPWPGAWIDYQGGRLHVLKSLCLEIPENKEFLNISKSHTYCKQIQCGALLKTQLTQAPLGIVCQDLRLFCPVEVKPQGGRSMPFSDFLKGHAFSLHQSQWT